MSEVEGFRLACAQGLLWSLLDDIDATASPAITAAAAATAACTMAHVTQSHRPDKRKRKRIDGAASPGTVTHGITLRGAQLTFAVLVGEKRVESRAWATNDAGMPLFYC